MILQRFSVFLKKTRMSLIFWEAERMEHSSILAMSLAVMQILKIFLDMVYKITKAGVVDT